MLKQADGDCGLKSPNYSRFDNSRHQHRLHVPSSLSRRLRSFREKFGRKPSSSAYSIRSEFPPPPDGKERRILSRNSTDILSSSGEESPLFNTPESNITPMKPDGRRVDPLAASGLLIATAELDRLSFSTNESGRPGMAITSPCHPRHCSDRDSSGSESGSSFLITTPRNMENRLSPPIPTLVHITPSPGQPQRLVRANRRQHSRLSEVTTPEEAGTPIETINESAASISPQQIPYSPGGFQSTPREFEAVDDETLIPRPLSIAQSVSSSPKPSSETLGIPMPPRSTSAPNYSTCYLKSVTKPELLSQEKHYSGVKSKAQF